MKYVTVFCTLILIAVPSFAGLKSFGKDILKGVKEKVNERQPKEEKQSSETHYDFDIVANESFRKELQNKRLTFNAVYKGIATNFVDRRGYIDRVDGYFNIILCDPQGDQCAQTFIIPISMRSRVSVLKKESSYLISGRLLNRYLGWLPDRNMMGHDWKAPITTYPGAHIVEVDSLDSAKPKPAPLKVPQKKMK